MLISTFYQQLSFIKNSNRSARMHEIMIDQSQMIKKIRQYGQELSLQQQQQFSLSFSQSENNNQERLPFSKPIRASKQLNFKALNFVYAKKYSSPYSKKQLNSGEQTYKKPITPGIKRRIFSSYQQQRIIEGQKNEAKKSTTPNKKYSTAKPKYLQQQPIVKNLSQYVKKNVYDRFKTEVQHMKPPRSLSRQEREAKWESFIKKNNEWEQARDNSLVVARINKNMKISQQLSSRPIRKSPPKMTVDDCLQKLRRQAEKLKQKLNHYTFEPKLFESERNKHKSSKSRSKSKQIQRQIQRQRQGRIKQQYLFQKQRQHKLGEMSTNFKAKAEKNSEHKRARWGKTNPLQLQQKKFTVIKNPAKQLQFMLA